MNILAALQGKKTYSLAIAGAATAAAAVASGQATPLQGLLTALVLGAQAFSRAGSKADANKVIATVGSAAAVASALAPIVAATVPGAAKAAGAVGEIAGELATMGVEQPVG